jgi:hypothetical protein
MSLNDVLSAVQNDPSDMANKFMTSGSLSSVTNITPTISTSLLNNYNDMINTMTNNAICDASCQYDASLNALYNAMQNAKLNEKQAPYLYEKAERAYYNFLGESVPNDFMNQKYLENYNVFVDEYKIKLNENIDRANKLNENYNTMYINTKNSYDLYLANSALNEKLRKQFNITASDVFTNDRKSIYENQGLATLQFHGKILFYLHILFVFCFIIAIFYYKTNLSIYSKLFFIILVILQPTIGRIIMYIINKILYLIKTFLPKNVYLTL